MKLLNKIALVTGSSSGIGAAIAKAMATEGADVIVNYHRQREGAEATANEVQRLGRKSMVVMADVGSATDVEKLFQAIRQQFGRLDILVNNAGVTLKKPFAQSDEREWDLIFNTNLKSVFLCSQQALPLMLSGGVILNISSVHAHITTHNFSVYAASKGGMEALTRSMAIELGEKKIRVNALRVGLINIARAHYCSDHPHYNDLCARIPVGRPGEVDDIALTAVHLCSNDAAFITGQIIVVDGGQTVTLNTIFPKGFVESGALNSIQ